MVAQVPDGRRAGRELLLVLPGFGAAVRAAGKALGRLPALELLLARADREPGVERDGLAEVAAALPSLAAAAALAPGPLARLADGGEPDAGWWSRADPVHLAVVGDQLRLLPIAALEAAEAQALASACAPVLAEHALRLEARAPTRWYLGAARPLSWTSAAPQDIAGADVYACLPRGADGGLMRRVLTELQMVLHEHAVNRARERAGLPSVNSLWPWGGGVAPASLALPDLGPLWTDDPAVAGLWRLAGSAAAALPERLDADCGVLVTALLARAARGEGAAGCAEALARVETAWARPALARVRARGGRIALRLGAAGEYGADEGELRRWWRRARPLARQVR